MCWRHPVVQVVITFLQWAAVMVGAPLGPLHEPLTVLAHRGEHDPSVRQADLLSAACVALVQLPPRELRYCWRSRHHKPATPLLALSSAVTLPRTSFVTVVAGPPLPRHVWASTPMLSPPPPLVLLACSCVA